jgi:hypothetical protein
MMDDNDVSETDTVNLSIFLFSFPINVVFFVSYFHFFYFFSINSTCNFLLVPFDRWCVNRTPHYVLLCYITAEYD